MPVVLRDTMNNLISEVRSRINDTNTSAPTFTDTDIQAMLDRTRTDVYNAVLQPRVTFSSGQITYLDYFAPLGMWEDDYTLKQFLTIAVTPSYVEPIVGHFQFAATTLPPVMITGKVYDIYRASADLLERMLAQWMFSYNVTMDGQTLHREGATAQIQALIKSYRAQQRPSAIALHRGDLAAAARPMVRSGGLGPVPNDYMASGN